MPILEPDAVGPDAGNLALVDDPRARHFWDPGGNLSPTFATLLGLPAKVQGWDVYLAYPAGAEWGEAGPPAPAFWHHQLSSLEVGQRLDPELFGEQLKLL